MTRKPWLSLLCGLLLTLPMTLHADSGGPSPGSTMGTSAGQVQEEYEAGYRALKAGDYTKAIKSFEQVLKDNPSHAMAYSNMGFAHRKLGQYDRAITLYHKALALEPNLAEAHEYIGEAYVGLGKISEAEKHLAILEKLDAKMAEELRQEIARHKRS